jgi:hypothetical protein
LGDVTALTTLAQALGIAWSSSVSLYGTVLFAGLAQRLGWIALPGSLEVLASPWVLGVAGALTAVEVLASFVPGVATAWEAVHTAIRPLASAALAVLTAWGSNPALVVVAGLLGGGLGAATHLTKLKLRAAVDASPEPFSNGAATAAELGSVAFLAWAIWNHPWVALAVALGLLLAAFLLARAAWRMIRRAASRLAGAP